MSFIDVSWATWIRIGWLAAATTASAWARTISMPLQPRHSPLSPQWHTWGRRRSRARWSSDMSVGPAIDPRLRWLLSLVHRVDLVGVPLGDDLPLDLEGGSDLARFLGEGAGQKREVFDSLPGANSLVDRVHGLVYQPDDAWVFDQLFGRAGDQLVDRSPVGDDESSHVRPGVADDHRLLDQVVALDLELELLRRHVLAAGGFEQIFLAVGDFQESVGVDLADV